MKQMSGLGGLSKFHENIKLRDHALKNQTVKTVLGQNYFPAAVYYLTQEALDESPQRYSNLLVQAAEKLSTTTFPGGRQRHRCSKIYYDSFSKKIT